MMKIDNTNGYSLELTSKFKKDYKRIVKRNYDLSLLKKAIEDICSDEPLDAHYVDHPLRGKLKGIRDLHIEDDWVLEYIKDKKSIVLTLMRTGTHQDLFNDSADIRYPHLQHILDYKNEHPELF